MMMQEKIRPATSADWQGILAVADQVLSFAKEDNREWWYERQHFETRDYRRRHYVVEAPPAASGATKVPTLVAYAAIEEGPEDNHYRVFLVLAPELLPSLGEQLYTRLVKDLSELGGEVAWVREETLNPVLDFFRKKGFVDQLRIHLSNGRDGLLLAKRLE